MLWICVILSIPSPDATCWQTHKTCQEEMDVLVPKLLAWRDRSGKTLHPMVTCSPLAPNGKYILELKNE